MTPIADKWPLPAEVKCFRPRRYYLVVGVLCAVYFSAIGVVTTVAAYWNLDGSFPRPKLAALVFGVFWSGWALLGVWNILAYFRERLFLTRKTITQQSVIRSRTISSEDVLHINWRWWPVGGSIVVQAPLAKVKIFLHNFTREEREEITRFFRETFARELQDNWLSFEVRPGRRSPSQRQFSRGGILIIASVLICFASVFVYCWVADAGWQYLFIGVINALAAISCLWRFLSAPSPS